MKNFEFSWTYGDYKIRSMSNGEGNPPYVELIKRCENSNGKSYFITLAFYRWDREGGELTFVGNRPFEEIAELDLAPIWKQLWLACKMLQDWYEKERWS